MNVSTKIRTLRANLGVSRYYLSKITNISEGELAKYEKGVTTPTIKNLSKLCSALGCTLSEFFNDDESVLYLTENEKKHLGAYRSLTAAQQDIVNLVTDEFAKKLFS